MPSRAPGGLAPAGRHLRIVREGERAACSLSLKPEGLAHRPAVDELFLSALPGAARAAAALLTGMGRDGAEGMRQLAERGAFTVAQDEATSVVYGMPGAAVNLQAAREVLPLPRIGPSLIRISPSRTRMCWSGGASTTRPARLCTGIRSRA